MTDPDWNMVDLKQVAERELPSIRTELFAVNEKLRKIEAAEDKVQSINLCLMLVVVLLALILWRVY